MGPLGEGSDRIGRDQADTAEDGVCDDRVAVEEPLFVVTEGEIVEGACAVPPHDVAGSDLGSAAAHGGTARRQAPVHDWAGQQVQGHHDEADTDGQQADGGIAVDGRREGNPADAHEAFG